MLPISQPSRRSKLSLKRRSQSQQSEHTSWPKSKPCNKRACPADDSLSPTQRSASSAVDFKSSENALPNRQSQDSLSPTQPSASSAVDFKSSENVLPNRQSQEPVENIEEPSDLSIATQSSDCTDKKVDRTAGYSRVSKDALSFPLRLMRETSLGQNHGQGPSITEPIARGNTELPAQENISGSKGRGPSSEARCPVCGLDFRGPNISFLYIIYRVGVADPSTRRRR